jgi:hypothetical protein
MSRPRCGPIDAAAVTKALGEGIPMLTLYRAGLPSVGTPSGGAGLPLALAKAGSARGERLQ